MDQLTIGLLGFGLFIVLTMLRMPIAYGMAVVGLGGMKSANFSCGRSR